MVPQEDVLFCKIAVSHGLVTQEQAKKCLAICNKREEEGKRRPMVGSVFNKYNLLRAQEVQRIYEAVNRRLGRGGGGSGSTTTMLAPAKERLAKGRGKKHHPPASAILARRQRQSARKVDNKTLAIGIVFGLVFLGVVGGILLVFISGREGEDAKLSKAGDKQSVAADISAQKPEEKAEDETPEKAAEQAKMDPSYKGEVLNFISDVRRSIIEDRPEQGLKALENFLQKRDGRYIEPYLEAELQSLLKEFKDRVSGDAAEDGEVADEDDDLDLDP